jgi:hypothetical protein
MARILIGLLIGLLVGGFATFYFFVGVPGSSTDVPGTPIRTPETGGVPPGTAQLVLRQDFFNGILQTIFREMNAPSFALTGNAPAPASQNAECSGAITILAEGSGVRTGVVFDNKRLEAPLAFTGAFNSPVGCVRFAGWAKSVLELRFDQNTQSVFGQLNVETVNLDGINPFVNAIATPLVQSTLNTRVNPIKIIEGRQITVDVPVASSNGNLKAAVKDVRAEIKENALNLFIEYDFSGGPLVAAPQPVP